MTERTMPEGLSDERGLLDGWLEYYRATLLAKCEGLSGEQLVTRSCEPSPMSLLGLVRHMTEMELVHLLPGLLVMPARLRHDLPVGVRGCHLRRAGRGRPRPPG